MIKLSITGIITLIIILLSTITGGSIGYTVDTIGVNSYYLEDRDTSTIIIEKNQEIIYPAASTIKLVTAMVVRKYLKKRSIVRIPRLAAGIEPTKAYLRWGERYYAEDLISALLIKSANDAAVALAIHTGGSESKFTRLMNNWCKQQNIKNTHFADASGISVKSVSSAGDLTRIFKIFISLRGNLELISKQELYIKSLKGRKIFLRNSNNLHLYRNDLGGVLVGKTGFTRRAGYCFTGMAYFRKRSYFITVMGADMAWHGISILMDYANDMYVEKKFSPGL